jgi:hypothetical protein
MYSSNREAYTSMSMLNMSSPKHEPTEDVNNRINNDTQNKLEKVNPTMQIDFVLVYSLDDSKNVANNNNNDNDKIDIENPTSTTTILNSTMKKHSKRQVNRQNELRQRTPKQKRVRFRKFFIHNLKTSGLVIKKVVDKQSKTVYLLIHTPFVKLLELAEKTKLKLPIEVKKIYSK